MVRRPAPISTGVSLKQRAVSSARLHLGRTALTQYLKKEGFEEALVIERACKPRKTTGAIDYFQDRVIFPITDRRNRVIGFGGGC